MNVNLSPETLRYRAAHARRTAIMDQLRATGFVTIGELAVLLGVSEMTRFGFGPKEFETLANLMADCILRNKPIAAEITKLRANFTELGYCFGDSDVDAALNILAAKSGL